MRALPLALVLVLLAVSGCNTKSAPPTEPPPAFDPAAASAMLTRTLQAQEAGDGNGVQADLFPRAPNTLKACSQARLSYSRSASIGLGDESGTPAHVTGVTLGTARQQGNAYVVDYTAIGNPAYSGSEMFVWANGRWWIKCQM